MGLALSSGLLSSRFKMILSWMWSIKFLMATSLFGPLLGVKSRTPFMTNLSCLSPTLLFRVWFLIYGSLILIFGTWISFPPSLILRPFKLFPKLWWWTASTRTLLANLLLPCVNTAREGGAELAPCCDTVAATGAGAARLTYSTVGTCSGRRRVTPVSVI